MSKSLNQVTLLGNLTRDPELRTTNSGQSVCSFSLALNRSYKGADGNWQEATDYVDCVAWGTTGENIAKWLQKGRQLLVSGSLQTRSWEQDGVKRTKLEVVVRESTFVGDGGQKAQPQHASNDIGDRPINLNDIPF